MIVSYGPKLGIVRIVVMVAVLQSSAETNDGDVYAAEELFILVYEELRRLAASKMAQERPGQTLDATGLVHEAYLRLTNAETARQFQSRGQFFIAAAEAMRRILVDRARRKRSYKRGGDRTRVFLDETRLAIEGPGEIIAVDEALERLARVDPQAAELVKLRYFVGLSIPDSARVLDMGARSADRLWAYARAWLRQAIGEQ